MVSQVPVIGVLMIVHGCINALLGAALAVGMSAVMIFAPPPGGDNEPVVIAIVYGVLGAVAIACGILNIVAGIRVRQFRSRTLALVTLFANMSTCLGGCWLMGMVVMIYGLIVMFNGDVAHAFDLVERGATPDEVQRRFAPGYDRKRYRHRDDDDEDDDFDDDLPPRRSNTSGPDDAFRPG